MEPKETGGLIRGLGPIATTALVAGNMIGSGIFVIPASLADVAGPLSLLAWVIVAVSFLTLTAVYADLACAYPISGGLQIYAQRAFGDLTGFLTAFLYWISCVIGNAAFVTAFVGYLQVFVPWVGLAVPAFFVAQAVLWAVTLVNILGVRAGGAVQVITTLLKVLPLLALSIALITFGSTAHLVPFAPKGYAALFPAISLVAWLFLGVESATVPAEEIQDAGPTIRRAAYAGYAMAAAAYLFVAFAISFGLPSSEVAGSASPLAGAARKVLGPGGEAFVTVGALVSIVGVLNGWVLVTGRLPFAAARQRLGPVSLARIHPRTGTPVRSLVLSAALSGLLVLLYFNGTLLEAYNFIALAATATALLAIGVACLAEIVLIRREPDHFTPRQRRRGPITALLGFLVVLLMIAGSGLWVGVLTLLTVVLPIPFFLALRRRRAPQSP